MPDSFFDTNTLLYIAGSDPAKAERTEDLLVQGGVISVQVLNEIANVARRKMRLDWDQAHALLATFQDVLAVKPVTLHIHQAGMGLAERYKFSVYDAMIVASALDAGCTILWSEDMQHGLRVNDQLRILDPYQTSA
jgi:predicted nucleic acid-binding protein